MEDDFPFNFGETSDQDQDDDSLFCVPKQKTGSRKQAPIEQGPYYAQIDKEGWFHRTSKSLEELMLQEKNGASKVKMRADHYYMLRQYQEAYDIAQEYCRIVATNDLNTTQGDGGLRRPEATKADIGTLMIGAGVLKVTDSKEMLEMALRCAMKLNRFEEAAELADQLNLQDAGVVFLKAKAYMAVGRFNDAALPLVQYQKARSRNSNYSIWRVLAECLHQSAHWARLPSAEQQPTTSRDSLSSLQYTSRNDFDLLALISILRARHLMRASTWSQVSFVRMRYERELKAIEQQRHVLERDCGLALHSSPSSGTDRDKALMLNDLTEYERKVIIPAQELLLQMKNKDALRRCQGVLNGEELFSIEVVEYVVNSWDPQLVSNSPVALETAEADEENGHCGNNVRNK
ncbi:hypothetical protein BG011_009202 [Mortierella polycephala]|uniref:Uncharacterized protein n=1 Tax=Mortierella polycephala TaxID=41804 RepID=A0A9P6TWH3_9FUNG|nr:hypothetical protein BG011_009202 [Mortierella polycephala]